MLIQTCSHNFLDKVEVRMGAVKAHIWKKLVEQAEIAEKSAKNLSPPLSKVGGESTTKAITQLNFLIHQHWKYMEELNQRRVTLTELQSIRDNTSSKISMW